MTRKDYVKSAQWFGDLKADVWNGARPSSIDELLAVDAAIDRAVNNAVDDLRADNNRFDGERFRDAIAKRAGDGVGARLLREVRA
jgi:hypothetical protein